MKNKYNLVIGISALAAIVAAVALLGYFVGRPRPEILQGETEASEYRVSCMVPGRVTQLYVREGDMVRYGDTLAFVDSPQVRARMAQARAAQSAAKAQSDKARNGAEQEQIAAAYELWQQAIVQEDILKRSFDRVRRLHEQRVVADQKLDETKAQYDAAAAQTRAAKSQYDKACKGAREEDRAAAEALVRQADGAIEEVESYLKELYLTAPSSGIISAIYPHQGELAGQGSPVMTITDLSDIWFTFNIREDRLHALGIGSTMTVSIPALDGLRTDATVRHIAARESYATWKATKETDRYDARTFEVRAVPVHPVKGLLPGMTVLVVE